MEKRRLLINHPNSMHAVANEPIEICLHSQDMHVEMHLQMASYQSLDHGFNNNFNKYFKVK